MNSKNQKSPLVGFNIMTAIFATLLLILMISFTTIELTKPQPGNNLQTQQQKPEKYPT